MRPDGAHVAACACFALFRERTHVVRACSSGPSSRSAPCSDPAPAHTGASGSAPHRALPRAAAAIGACVCTRPSHAALHRTHDRSPARLWSGRRGRGGVGHRQRSVRQVRGSVGHHAVAFGRSTHTDRLRHTRTRTHTRARARARLMRADSPADRSAWPSCSPTTRTSHARFTACAARATAPPRCRLHALPSPL